MNFACPSRIDCPGTDLPFANLSAEAPDQDVFFGFYTGAPWLQPPIGSNWTRNSCLGQCSSTESQADADLCAAIANASCMFQDWGPPGVYGNGGPSSGPPVVAPPSNPTPVFLNVTTQCTIHCPDGSPFTYQVRAGLFPGINQATADAAAVSYACQLATVNAICLSALSSKACVGTAYSDAIAPSRPALYTFVLISGSLPPGLTLASGPSPTGPITGTPTTPGSYTFVVRVTNQVGNWMQKTYTINVMAFVDTTLPDANKGQLYTHVLTATGGTAPYTYTLELGSLPTGITLASDGTLSGTPTVTGDFSVTLGVADAGINFCTKAFTLHVSNVTCPTLLVQNILASNSMGIAPYCVTSDIIHPNKVLVAEQPTQQFDFYDADSQTFLGNLAFSPNGWFIHSAAYAPGTDKCFVALQDNFNLNFYLQIINMATSSIGAQLSDGATGLASGYFHCKYSADLVRVFMLGPSAAVGADTDLLTVNPTTNAFTRFSCTQNPGVGFEDAKDADYCPLNNRFYAGCQAGVAGTSFLRGVNATTHAFESAVDFGADKIQAVCWIPSTSRLLVSTVGGGVTKVHIYNTTTDTVEDVINLGAIGNVSNVTVYWPDKGLFVLPASNHLYFIDPGTKALVCSIAIASQFQGYGISGPNLFVSGIGSTLLTSYH